MRMRFEKEVRRFDLSGFEFNRTDEDLFKNNFQMFNLKQLEYSRDSLYQKHIQEKNNFSLSMYRNYYHYSQHQLSKPIQMDSILVFMGDFLKGINYDEHSKIIDNALNTSRNVKSSIEARSDFYENELRLIRRHMILNGTSNTHYQLPASYFFFVGAPLGGINGKVGWVCHR